MVIGILIFDEILEEARYLNIQVVSPTSYKPNGGWSYLDRIERRWNRSGSLFFITRQETTVTSADQHPGGYEFLSWEDIINYFDDRLDEKGWSRTLTSCDNYIQESDFIPKGKNGWVAYKKYGSEDYAVEPTVCIAIFPTNTLYGETYYRVVFYTVRPSIFTQLRNNWH